MEKLIRIHKLGKAARIVSKIIAICLTVAAGFVLAGAIIMTAMPADAFTVSGEFSTDVDINVGSYSGLWAQMVGIDGFDGNVDKDGFSVKFFDTGLSVNGATEPYSITVRQIAGLLYCGFASLLLFAGVFYCAARFGKILERGDSPFSEESSKSLVTLGIATLVWSLGGSIVEACAGKLVTIPQSPFNGNFQFDFGTIIIALFFLLLSCVFKYGAALQREADETL